MITLQVKPNGDIPASAVGDCVVFRDEYDLKSSSSKQIIMSITAPRGKLILFAVKQWRIDRQVSAIRAFMKGHLHD